MNSSELHFSGNYSRPPIPYSVEVIRQICIALWANIILVGVLGNILTVIILAGPKLRSTSTTFYLTVLAIIDILYLLFSLGGQMFDFALLFPKNMRQKTELSCKLLNIICYSLAYISVWLLVAVSIDRMIWVLLPFRAKLICTRKIAKAVVLFFFIFFVGIDIHFVWTVRFIKKESINHCVMINNTMFKYTLLYIDLTLVVFLPFIIMLISNILIVIKMKKVFQMRQILHRSSTVLESCQSDHHKLKRNSIAHPLICQDKITSSLTRMLLSVNIFFIVSTSPLLVYNIVYYVVDINYLIQKNGNYFGGIIFGLERLVYTLWYLNFAIHFLLYCLSGPRFREEAKLFINKHFFRGYFSTQNNSKLLENKVNNYNLHQPLHSHVQVKSRSLDIPIQNTRSFYSCIKETRI